MMALISAAAAAMAQRGAGSGLQIEMLRMDADGGKPSENRRLRR
jgi:hypothetical protein